MTLLYQRRLIANTFSMALVYIIVEIKDCSP